MIQQIAMKALIVNDEGNVLILREAPTYGQGTQRGRYELPGGRVELGELHDQALHREVQEETGLKITIMQPIHMGEWRPVIKGVTHQIIGVFVVCRPKGKVTVVLSTEHDKYQWIRPEDYRTYRVLPPDDQALARLAEWQKSPLSL